MTIRNAGKAPRYYETKGSAAGQVAKLTKMLTEYGADSFMVENRAGSPVGVAFQLNGLAYAVRPNVEGVRARLDAAKRKGKATAETVAWAQSFHLLEMQLEAIESGAATSETVLGGYVLMTSGETVGQAIERRTEELLPGSYLMLPSGVTP